MNKSFFLGVCLFMLLIAGCEKRDGYKVISEGVGEVSEGKSAPLKQDNALKPDSFSLNETAEEAELRINPFFTSDEEESFKKTGNVTNLNYLNITAIFYNPENSKAVIDGRILAKGDFIDNKEIVKIEPEQVFLKDTEGEYVVKLGEQK